MMVLKNIVQTPAQWARELREMSTAKVIAFDTEFESRGWPNTIPVGFSLSWRKKKGVYRAIYVPLNHFIERDGQWVRRPDQMTPAQVKRDLKRLLCAGERLVVCHNLQAELKTLHLLGIDTDGMRAFDTMLASWMLETDRDTGHGLKELTRFFFKHKMHTLDEWAPDEEVVDESKPPYKSGPRKGQPRTYKTGIRLITRVPLTSMADYGADDAFYCLRLYKMFAPQLVEAKFDSLFNDLIMEVVPYLCEMEEHGMVIDRKGLLRFRKDLRKQIREAAQKVFDQRPGKSKGVEFNIGSSKQLNEVLFGNFRRKIGLNHYKANVDSQKSDFEIEPRGKPGARSGLYQTDKRTMKYYVFEGYDVVRDILEVNKLSHLEGMISGWLSRAVQHPDGTWRLHGNFNLHTVRTGRLSSSDPNLQNIPVRDKSLPVRKFFVGWTEGWKKEVEYVFADADYAQIELKLLAHFSRDERMVRVMNAGGDLHSEMAKLAYKLKVPAGMSVHDEGKYIKEHHDTERGRSKNMNFAIVYGAGPNTVSINYDIPLPEAERLHKYHRHIFPGAHRWIARRQKFAAKYGYVRTLFGRKRQIRNFDINPFDYERGSDAQRRAFGLKGEAMRVAVNSSIQGSAADIILLAMRNIRRFFKKRGLWYNYVTNPRAPVIPAAQVHDELCLYFRSDVQERARTTVQKLMNSAVTLRVSTEAEVQVAKNWMDAK